MLDPLRERREQILNRLADLEILEGPDADGEREALTRDLESVRSSLEQLTPRRALPILRSLRLVRGCDVPWSAMVGTARVRHCSSCDREVYDLTAMDPDEIEAFLAERKAALPCLRLRLRPDGRVQDGPCAPARARLTRAIAVAMGLGLAATGAYLADLDPRPSAACATRRGGDTSVVTGEYRELRPAAPPVEPEPFGWDVAHPRPAPPFGPVAS